LRNRAAPLGSQLTCVSPPAALCRDLLTVAPAVMQKRQARGALDEPVHRNVREGARCEPFSAPRLAGEGDTDVLVRALFRQFSKKRYRPRGASVARML